jgi:scytalone dehydratase
LGKKVLGTQHLFGIPYFKHVTADEIVIEYTQLGSHGRRAEGEDYEHPMSKIGETSDGRGWVQPAPIKVGGQWRISVIKPEAIYHIGDFQHIRRSEDMT